MAKPEIRLKGFEGEWEKYPFHVVAKPYFVSNKFVHHQNLLSLSYGKIKRKDINSGKGLLPASFDTYQIIKDGIIVFRFTDLQNDKKSLRVGLAKEEGIISPAYVCVECENVSPEFLFLQLYSYDLRKVFYSMGDGLRQTLSYNDVKEMTIYVPSDKEQKLIIDYFNSLELDILSAESKLASLKQMKSACLVSMFPQAGETTPRVRFKGFEREWKFVKLGSLCEKITRKASVDTKAPVMMISASSGFINQSEKYSTDNAGQSLAKYTLLYKGEMAYNHGASKIRKYGSCFALDRKEARVPFVYHTFKLLKDDSYFFAYYLNSGIFDSELRKVVSSTARMDGLLNISYETYMNLNVYRPDYEEQKRIASYFRSLDKQISLLEKQLEKLKQIKAACLDKMFV